MIIEDKNKIEALERKILELERKIEEINQHKEIINFEEKLTTGFQDNFKSDKGEIILKKTGRIRNRKGIFNWSDNVIAVNFLNTNEFKLNQIQIGSDIDDETRERITNTNAIFLYVTENKNAKLENESPQVKLSNGSINIGVLHDDNKNMSGITIHDRLLSVGDLKGKVSILTGSQLDDNNPITGLAQTIKINEVMLSAVSFHTEKDTVAGGIYQQHLKQYVDILPVTVNIIPSLGRKGFHYRELVLRSPDNSSWAVRIDNAGNLTRTKL